MTGTMTAISAAAAMNRYRFSVVMAWMYRRMTFGMRGSQWRAPRGYGRRVSGTSTPRGEQRMKTGSGEQAELLHERHLAVDHFRRQLVAFGSLAPDVDRLFACFGDIGGLQRGDFDPLRAERFNRLSVGHQDMLTQRSGYFTCGRAERYFEGVGQCVVGPLVGDVAGRRGGLMGSRHDDVLRDLS